MNLFRKHNSQNDAKLLENVGKCSFSLHFSRKNIIMYIFSKLYKNVQHAVEIQKPFNY